MAISIGVSPANAQGLGTSQGVNLTGTTSGHGVIVGVLIYGTTGTVSSVDVSGQSATLQGSIFRTANVTDGGGQQASIQFAYLASLSSGGAKTVTASFSGNFRCSVFAMTVTGHDTTTFPDTTPVGAQAASGARSVSITTATDNAMLVSYLVNTNTDETPSGSETAFSPDIGNSWWFENGSYLLDAGGAGSKSTGFSGTSGGWIQVTAAYRAAAGAPSGQPAARRNRGPQFARFGRF